MQLATSRSERVSLLVRGFWVSVFAGLAWLLMHSVTMTADYTRYLNWSDALQFGDIFLLESRFASPVGVPLMVHSAGPSMLIATGFVWFREWSLPIAPDMLMNWLGMVCAWWALLRLMLHLTDGNIPVATFAAGLGFLGTHLGFCSSAYSSEAMSLFALSVLFNFALVRERPGLFDAMVVGMLSGLAILIRAQLAIYVALPMLVSAYRAYRWRGSVLRTLPTLLLIGVPLLVAFVQLAYLNRWMTGSWVKTPYEFGDDQFHSVDWHHPLFSAVLSHFRHGLLAYHPLYLVGYAAAVYLMLRARGWGERLLLLGIVAVVSAHLYLQAAWFIWWLGSDTFGMRGMAPCALMLVPALAVVIHRWQSQKLIAWPLITVCLLGALWGALQYCRGISNFDSWADLWHSQVLVLEEVGLLLFLPITIGGAAALLLRRSGQSLLGWAAALLAILIALRVRGPSLLWSDAARLPHAHAPWSLALVAGALTLVFVVVLWVGPKARPASRWPELLVGVFVLAVMATSGHMFLRLAENTEKAIARGEKLEGRNVKTTNVLWDELKGNYNDYLTIPGFDEEKERIQLYLTRHHDEWRGVWMPVPEYRKRQMQERREKRRQRRRHR
jgi:hypothetical protein